MIGQPLGHYRILEKLGEGGMGEVYRAEDSTLKRQVALKVLPTDVAGSQERLDRFQREAESLAALNHPNIVHVYSVEEGDGVHFLTMELVDGQSLDQLIPGDGLPIERLLDLSIPLADALAEAHEQGIVHRDLKPANIMIDHRGQPKILDFGLAKLRQAELSEDLSQLPTDVMTRAGTVLGTYPYMSPEQVEGKVVDSRSDIFSLGVVLHEMATGERPFKGESSASLIAAILTESPAEAASLRSELPPDFGRIISKCLEKDPEKRYRSSGELVEALRGCAAGLAARSQGLMLGRRTIAAALALVVMVGAAVAWFGLRDDVVRWIERDTLAEITRLSESGDLYEAFRLVRGVEQKLPDDRQVQQLLNRITVPISIVTDPPGAEVEVKGYATAETDWVRLGETPLNGVRIPYALTHWRISKEGFEPFEGAPFGLRPITAFMEGFPLDPEGTRPEKMVRVPGGPYTREGFHPVELDDYWLDRYEITNREFKEFVDSGGYEKEEYWTEPFVEDGQKLPRQEAMARLVDTTGRPGSAGWEFGSYDAGQDDLPVGGVSWYEAAAYCRYAGKSLPTLFHWSGATAQDQLSDILLVSNFGTEGPAPVGSHPGLGDFGNYDMAGNVKEWCWNEAQGERYILGGAWNDPKYMFRGNADLAPPLSREPTHGFRCVRYSTPPAEELLAPVESIWHAGLGGDREPVPDEVFEAYRRMFAYDPSDLDAKVESLDESSLYWRKETISFDAAYGGERVIAYLFLPRNAEPPYQTVVWYPGDDAFLLPPGEALASPYLFDFIPRSGRALVYPVYKGMYERYTPFSFAPNEWRDMMIMWSKDLSRTVDYLEERPDIDTDKLAYYGFSGGAVYGPIFTAIDERFKASALVAGGLISGIPPEIDTANYAPRSRVPTLMINGKEDFLTPVETSQKPLLRLLGTAEDEKRLVQLEGGHIPPDRLALINEVLGWFDRFLGPVETS
jgi:pimeloyl-ACP methyl ester carboxylesterase